MKLLSATDRFIYTLYLKCIQKYYLKSSILEILKRVFRGVYMEFIVLVPSLLWDTTTESEKRQLKLKCGSKSKS